MGQIVGTNEDPFARNLFVCAHIEKTPWTRSVYSDRGPPDQGMKAKA
jgi:hypothetical protein